MDHIARVTEALESACEPLHDALSEGVLRSQEAFSGMPGSLHAWAGPAMTHFTRAWTISALVKAGGIDGWDMDFINNSSIILRRGTVSMRLLHQLQDGSAPHPGPNAAREQYYMNDLLPAAVLPRADKLLALWSTGTAGETIRIVRPVGTWKFGRQEKVDLDFILPRYATDIRSLEFETSDEDLFADIPVETEEEGSA
ncbi:hypothetical protein [Nesterenkonia sp. CF4.4]|uniref:hypothetical protein n=1 Tax=Nesterenkonia sp. CF4.4 TaxID=3373079 RepID=UPI003EE6D10F